MSIRVILTDIEGTTSSISFVKDTLFPYAVAHLPGFIRANAARTDVQEQLRETARLVASDQGMTDVDATDTLFIEELIETLLQWIKADRKATPLKTLQGLIWEAGYRTGDYQAHMYPDATASLRQWHHAGIPVYVYSSGSIKAQALFFEFSQDGNLLPLFRGHFDTTIGAKQEVQAYRKITDVLKRTHGVQAADVLFLSDIEAELDAARAAGMQTTWLIRDGEAPLVPSHPVVRSFQDIELARG